MNKVIVTLLLIGSIGNVLGQVKEAHLTLAIGNSQGTASLLAGYDWELGTKKKLALGLGVRFTSYFGSNQYYRTAPAKLTTGSTGPLVIFKEDIPENIDTLLLASPQVNSFNVFINLRYAFSAKIQVGFNIDAIGFSFGGSKQGTYLNFPQGSATTASPATFNLLLISDNDKGSLNSELYLKYAVSEQWSVKTAAQFHFTEYITETAVQQFPEPNDRFRNKTLLFAVGIIRNF
ncbi:hypothetical protein QQ054_30085 [Oscillatoria amoena NRMC-F 0135]|nr:hypothetical protein [Oscillatoria amoena NRMC-F 0135]